MQLNELLEHLGKHVLDDRTDLLDGDPDELWDDAVLVRYLNDGQNQFCRRAWPIVDDSSPVCCVIPLVADKTVYDLHKSVLSVLSVTPNDTDIPLGAVDFRLIAPQPFTYDPYYQMQVPPLQDVPGRPLVYSMDEATRTLRIRPAPNAQAVTDIVRLNLRVARLPLKPLDVEKDDSCPEIADEYHLDLCDYAAGKALTQSNVDSGDARVEGERLIAAFFSKIRAAKNDRMIAQKAPGQYMFGGWAKSQRV